MTEPSPSPAPGPIAAAAADDAPSPFLVALLAWLVPGAGHFYIGYTVKAAVFFFGVLGLILFGSALGDWRIVAFPDAKGSESPAADNLWFLVQLGSGLSTILLGILNRGHEPIAANNQILEIANLYCRVAGMLNILLVIDAYSRAEAMCAPAPLRLSRPAQPPALPDGAGPGPAEPAATGGQAQA
jgi:hypothetical protein